MVINHQIEPFSPWISLRLQRQIQVPFFSKKVLPFKKKISYFRFESLPYEKKISASTILDEEFIRHFLQLSISPSRKKLVHLPSGRVLMEMANKETERQFDHTMVSSFRLAIMGQPQLYIISRQLLGQKLFAWLDKISDGRAFNLQTKQLRSSATYRSKCKDQLQENNLWFSKRSFHRLEAWLGNQLEMTLLDSYFNFTHTYSRIVDLQKYIANEPEILQNTSLTLEQIAENSVMKVFEAVRQKIITYETSMREIFEAELLNEIQKKEKKKKRRKPAKKIVLSSDETSSTKLTFHNSIENEQSTDQCPTEDLSQILSKINLQEQNNSSSDQKEESAEILQISQRNSKQRSQSPQSSKKENDENVQKTLTNAEVVEINDSSTVEDHLKKVQPAQCEKKKKKRRRNHKESSVVISSFKEKVFMIILNKQLTEYIDRICIETNNLYQSKIIAFQRVRVFVQRIFPSGQAILFGSNAVGLSLPSSDIDIMLFSLNCGSREEANNCLSQIASLINTMGWVTSCSTYLAAKVPLIKLEIDTSINYFAGKGTKGYSSSDPLGYYLEVKDRRKCAVIKVDITISLDEKNLCSPSTELMRERVGENAQMQRILLILKHILAIKGFNQNFTGGIGSYCLFVMVAAYFAQFKPTEAETQADTFLSILKFYGQDFDNKTRIVSIHKGLVETDASAFPKYAEYEKKIDNPQPLISSNLLKIVDPLTGSIMSNSRNQFLQIKAQFNRIRSEIMDFSADVQDEINKVFLSPVIDVTKLAANPRQFDRWVSKYELRSGFSVEQIIQYEG